MGCSYCAHLGCAHRLLNFGLCLERSREADSTDLLFDAKPNDETYCPNERSFQSCIMQTLTLSGQDEFRFSMYTSNFPCSPELIVDDVYCIDMLFLVVTPS